MLPRLEELEQTTTAEQRDSNNDDAQGGAPRRTAAENITTHAAWDRYLSLIQGRSSYAPIKFNGQDFLSNQSGRGWDYRVWGEAYWCA